MELKKENKLLGLVVSKFGSIRKLADALGWSYSKAYRIITGTQEPGAADIATLSDIWPNLSGEDILEIFILPWRSQNANN